MNRLLTPVGAAACMLASNLACATVYTESTLGDLSNDHLAPTQLILQTGSNVISGTFGQSSVPDEPDRDYFTVQIAAGSVLTQVILQSLDQGGDASFLAVQVGNEITMAPTSTDPSMLLGYGHIRQNQINKNLLPLIGVPTPLTSGTYSFWVNETDTSSTYSYSLDFKVESAVPEPATGVLALVSLAAFFTRTRRVRTNQV